MIYKKLNLGCGKAPKKGYLNLDSIRLKNVDIIHDLNKYPWPFEDEEFEEIYCDNILEHLQGIIKPMEEIWSISKNKAKIIVKVPIFPSIWAFSDPTHKNIFTLITFDYFREDDGLNYYSKARFKIINKKIIFSKYLRLLTWLFNINPKIQKFYYLFLSFLFPANSLYFELEAIK